MFHSLLLCCKWKANNPGLVVLELLFSSKVLPLLFPDPRKLQKLRQCKSNTCFNSIYSNGRAFLEDWHHRFNFVITPLSKASYDSSVGRISAWYQGGPRFKSRQGREFFNENKLLNWTLLATLLERWRVFVSADYLFVLKTFHWSMH